MVAGTICIVWFSKNFLLPFQGFLITIGVPLAAWSAIFVADVIFRKEIIDSELFNLKGIYRGSNWPTILVLFLATFIGFGFVTNTFAPWLYWQGYFLDLIGGKNGQWASANIGVIIALAIGFIGQTVILKRLKK